jgi:hypothetical protein
VPFLLDNDVPDVVARVLVEAGHEVFLLRNVLPKKSADSLCSIMPQPTL